MKIGIGRTHGKIILIGEHAVVYESRAISIPFFETECVVEAYDSNGKTSLVSSLYQGDLDQAGSAFDAISSLITELEKKLALPPLEYNINSTIPVSAGMGSSAAVAGAIVEAVYDYLDLTLSEEEHFEWIQFAERISHGNPSGIDALTVSRDEAWVFQRGKKPICFNQKLNAYLVVGQSGVLGSTKVAVSSVRRLVDSERKYHIIESISETVEHAYAAYLKQDVVSLGRALNRAQEYLTQLEVSVQEIDEMVMLAQVSGALGAKLTGGGLGGCVIALAQTKDVAQAIQKSWEEFSGLSAWILDLNEEKQ